MKIIAMRLNNFQGIKGPTTIYLSPQVTNLNGGNAKGKSTIVRALKLFAGVFNKQDIEGLYPFGDLSKTVTVELLLDNLNTLAVSITGNLTPEYSYLNTNKEILGSWYGFSEDITNILGWKVTSNGMMLNEKKSRYNIGIDTSPTETSEIMEYICRDIKVEERIKNIEDSFKIVKDINNPIISEYNSVINRISELKKINYEKGLEIINSIEIINKELNKLKILEDIATKLTIFMAMQNTLNKGEKILQTTREINYNTRKNNTLLKIKEISQINNVKNIAETMNTILKKINNLHTTLSLIDELQKIRTHQDIINKLNEINITLKNLEKTKRTNEILNILISKTNENKSILKNINILETYDNYKNNIKSHKNQQYLLQQIQETTKVKKFYDTINNIVKHTNKITFYKNILSTINTKNDNNKELINNQSIYSIILMIKYLKQLNSLVHTISELNNAQSELNHLKTLEERIQKINNNKYFICNNCKSIIKSTEVKYCW